MRIIIALFLCISHVSFSQEVASTDSNKHSTISPFAGLGINFHYSMWGIAFMELGVAHLKYGKAEKAGISRAIYVSSEFYPFSPFAVAPKLGTWFSLGQTPLSIGLSVLYFTDFSSGAFFIRPEAGYSKGMFRIYYSLNGVLPQRKTFPLSGNHVLGVSIRLSKNQRTNL